MGMYADLEGPDYVKYSGRIAKACHNLGFKEKDGVLTLSLDEAKRMIAWIVADLELNLRLNTIQDINMLSMDAAKLSALVYWVENQEDGSAELTFC
jgi:hypothetical protein